MRLSDLSAAIRQIDGSENNALRRIFDEIEFWATELENAIGVDPLYPAARARGGVTQTSPPPPLCTFTATAESGAILIEITLPQDIRGILLHEIKTSDTLPFKASTTVTTYPLNPATRISIAVAGAKYVQLRSRYLTSDFNKPLVSTQVTPLP